MSRFHPLRGTQSELIAKRYLPFGTSIDNPLHSGALSSYSANQAMTGSMVITGIGFEEYLCLASIPFSFCHTATQLVAGLVCIRLLMTSRSTVKPRSSLSIVFISHIIALELLNALGFVIAFLGLYLCVYPMRVGVASYLAVDTIDESVWRWWQRLYLTSTGVFVAGGVLTDGIMVS